jgi:hypothetical protein
MKIEFPLLNTESHIKYAEVSTAGIATVSAIEPDMTGEHTRPVINLMAIVPNGDYAHGYLQIPEDASVLRELGDEMHRIADECETSDYTFQIGALFRVIRRLVQNQMVAQEDIEERLAAECELAVADHYLEDFIRTMVLSDCYDEVWDIIAEEAPYSLKGLKEVGEKGCELPQAGQEPDDQDTCYPMEVLVACRNSMGEPDMLPCTVWTTKE